MGTKNKPGTYDCYANAHPDEPMFILLARDPFAPMLVEKWAELREAARGPSAKVGEARACADAMRKWLAAESGCRVGSEPIAIVGETKGKDPREHRTDHEDCG